MRLSINYNPSTQDLFVQGEWADGGGGHSVRLTEGLSAALRQAALDLAQWANAQESSLVAQAEKYTQRQAIEQEIGRLQAKLAALR